MICVTKPVTTVTIALSIKYFLSKEKKINQKKNIVTLLIRNFYLIKQNKTKITPNVRELDAYIQL